MTTHDELQVFIATATVSDNDKTLWKTIIPHLDEETVISLVGILHDDPTQLSFLTNNLRAKAVALQGKNTSAWDKVVDEELTYIDTL